MTPKERDGRSAGGASDCVAATSGPAKVAARLIRDNCDSSLNPTINYLSLFCENLFVPHRLIAYIQKTDGRIKSSIVRQMPSPSDGRTDQTDGVCNNRLSIQSPLLPPPSLPRSVSFVPFPSPRVFCPPPPPLLIETARNRKRRRRSSAAIQIAFFRLVISRTH